MIVKQVFFIIAFVFMIQVEMMAQNGKQLVISGTPFFTQAFYKNKSKYRNRQAYEGQMGYSINGAFQFPFLERYKLAIGGSYTNWSARRKSPFHFGNTYNGTPSTPLSEAFLAAHPEFAPFFIDTYNAYGILLSLSIYSNGERLKFFARGGLVPSIISTEAYDPYEKKAASSSSFNVKSDLAIGLELLIYDRFRCFVSPNAFTYFTETNWVKRDFLRGGYGVEAGVIFSFKKRKTVESF